MATENEKTLEPVPAQQQKSAVSIMNINNDDAAALLALRNASSATVAPAIVVAAPSDVVPPPKDKDKDNDNAHTIVDGGRQLSPLAMELVDSPPNSTTSDYNNNSSFDSLLSTSPLRSTASVRTVRQPSPLPQLRNSYSSCYSRRHSHNRSWEEFPTTEAEARAQLEIILNRPEWKDCNNGDDFEHVVDVLKHFPAMAGHMFGDSDGNGYYPLVHLMFAKASIDTLFEIYTFCPTVLMTPQGKDQSLPLHIACCRLEDSDHVIFVLSRLNVLALQQYNGIGMLPIHCALVKHERYGGVPSSFAVIRYLMERNPMSAFLRSSQGISCLDFAVHGGYDIFVLNYILSKLPHPLPIFHMPHAFLNKPILLDLNKARVLEDFLQLHHVQHLECEPAQWKQDSLHYFIKCLQNNPSSTRLHLKFPPSLMNSDCRFSFQQALQDNTNLSKIALVCADEDSYKDSSVVLDSLRVGLESNTTIHTLRLCQFQGRLLDVVLGSSGDCKSPLRTLELLHVAFTDNLEDWSARALARPGHNVENGNVLQASNSTSQLQNLQLHSCTIPPSCLRKLLQELVHLPSLQDLFLDILGPDSRKQERSEHEQDSTTASPGTTTSTSITNYAAIRQQYDMTAPLLAIIGKGKLKQLAIGTYPLVQVAPLCEELKKNTSLQFLNAPSMFADDYSIKEAKLLDVLALHNTHLQRVKTHTMNEKISHFTNLNMCGRTKARDESTSRPEFVELLCSVAILTTTEKMLKHSLVFGLLRESPNLWSLEADGNGCASPNSRKRRRQDAVAA